MQPLVVFEGIGVTRDGNALLTDVDLEVAPGDVVGVSGPNGSGKTTLLRLVATLIRPNRGSGTVLGARMGTAETFGIRERIGLIGHEPALVPELTVFENLDHIARLGGLDRTRVMPVLETVGLGGAAHRRVRAASRGMQRRVEIAHMLLRQPELLLLDEAASGLDADASGLIDALTRRITSSGGAVVTVSHDPAHLDGCTRQLRISAGRLALR